MAKSGAMSGPTQNLTLFDRTQTETLALLEEVRAFVAARRWDDLPSGTMINMLSVREALRVTTRLTQVLAWLLARRAVAEGEITAEEAALSEKWRLGASSICRDRSGDAIVELPDTLHRVLERSYRLYVRVARLDELVRGQAGPRRQLAYFKPILE